MLAGRVVFSRVKHKPEARRSVRLLAKELSGDEEVMITPRGSKKRRVPAADEVELGTDGKARRPR
jgi:hypothetical protein